MRFRGEWTNSYKPDLQQSRGCLGCCPKPPLVIAVDEPSNGLRIPGRMVKKPSILEDFWSTSTYEMDHSASASQRSVPSMSTSNLPPDLHASGGNASNPTEFVNHDVMLRISSRTLENFEQNSCITDPMLDKVKRVDYSHGPGVGGTNSPQT
ncbi:unnamed protein product [Thlaspi arvense]|uniref:Uncharacterized protein n=1 Tax=Thlaspi arvense TaxID=13288 RepID=A0AAU9RT32_THLAR|nr:unnamed protein product [Thlaspi arvense]